MITIMIDIRTYWLIIHTKDFVVGVILMMNWNLDLFIWIQLITILYLGYAHSAKLNELNKTTFICISLYIWYWVIFWLKWITIHLLSLAIINNLILRLSEVLTFFVFFILFF